MFGLPADCPILRRFHFHQLVVSSEGSKGVPAYSRLHSACFYAEAPILKSVALPTELKRLTAVTLRKGYHP